MKLMPENNNRAQSSGYMLQSLIYNFSSRIKKEDYEKYNSMAQEAIDKAIKADAENPVVAVSTATTLIREGGSETKPSTMKVLAGIRLLRAAKQVELERLGRMAWADEEFRRLEEVRWTEPVDSESFRRVKGSALLGPEQLAVLREVYGFRERRARERDRPPFKILSQDVLLGLARARPVSRSAVREVAGLPRSWLQPARCDELLRAVEQALALPEDQRPAAVRRTSRKPRSPGFRAGVAKLREQRDRLAERLSLEPSLLLPRAVLEEVIERRQEGRDIGSIPDLRAWQLALLEL